MRVLILHPEHQYFAGAETMLGYFLKELVRTDCKVAVAAVTGSRVADSLPEETVPVWLEPCPAFSPLPILRQAVTLKKFREHFEFDLVHGWTARDWELATFTGWLCQRPAVGTLHDHPRATFISSKRRQLMSLCARWGLAKVICVSDAVRTACEKARYSESKLAVVRNGLPISDLPPLIRDWGPVRLGFLGMFSERKGLRTLFQIVDALPSSADTWELDIAGDAADEAGKQLLEDIRKAYATRAWWPRVKWLGWVSSPQNFLRSLDLLIVPSSQFDPFPTVLLEAGQMGVPVFASRVGGVPEIVAEGQTGWLFDPGAVDEAVVRLGRLIETPRMLQNAGQAARERIRGEFSASKMVAEYRLLYSNLLKDV